MLNVWQLFYHGAKLMSSNRDKMDVLTELAREAGIDRRDIQEIYNLYQYVSLENAVSVAQNFFHEKGFCAPDLDDLDDPDFELQ